MTKRRLTMSVPLVLCCSAFFACGSDEVPDEPPVDYSACAGPKSIYMTNVDLISTCFDAEGDICAILGLALAKDREADLGLIVFDDRGNRCDPAGIAVEFDDSSFVRVISTGRHTVIETVADFFDRGGGREPSTKMRLKLGMAVEEFQVMAVVDIAGTWNVEVDGLVFGDFNFVQFGRQIRYADCAETDTGPQCTYAGIVKNDALSLNQISDFKLDGVIAPDRARVDGVWTTDADNGVWTAIKVPQ